MARGLCLLARRIKSVGGKEISIAFEVLKNLSAPDLACLQRAATDVARGLCLLARRIKSVGGKEISIAFEVLKNLSAPDLACLQRAADELDRQVGGVQPSLGKCSPKLG